MNVVRVKSDEDLAVCLEIRREVFIEEQGVSVDEEIDEQDSVDVGHHLYICHFDGVPSATARYQAYGPNEAKIQRVAVRKAFRGMGYGRRVMDAIEQMAAENGFATAVLDAQYHAQPFYEQLGYEEEDIEPFLDAGILHVRMQKPIGSRSGV